MPISIREHVPLRDLTTFRTGGSARYFCVVTSEAELAEAVAWAQAKNAKLFILGGGSNILVSDAGFDGLVIKMDIQGKIGQLDTEDNFSGKNTENMANNHTSSDPIFQLSEKTESVDKIFIVTAGAGEIWDDFVGECVKRGLGGIENLSGIPGTVGAAPVQNIGAYGAEVSQTISSVRVFDTQRLGSDIDTFSDILNTNCHFQYRDSIFKHEKNEDGTPRYIITSVTFNLKKDAPVNAGYKDVQEYFSKNAIQNPTAHDVRSAVLSIRAAKLPDVRVIGTAGSFFKNPIISAGHFEKLKEKYPDLPSYPASSGLVKVPLGWILDHICGYKGAKKGNVGTYKNQALVIVNEGNATAEEIKKFADEITAMVKEKTNIDIEPEVQYVS